MGVGIPIGLKGVICQNESGLYKRSGKRKNVPVGGEEFLLLILNTIRSKIRDYAKHFWEYNKKLSFKFS